MEVWVIFLIVLLSIFLIGALTTLVFIPALDKYYPESIETNNKKEPFKQPYTEIITKNNGNKEFATVNADARAEWEQRLRNIEMGTNIRKFRNTN